ncbi:MAG: MotA/TolQ/ExbB proton channel family protein [Candidatus Cloacimonetes bacterium]|nr:MotA/TolQ/ExbB proton channel family protein [Candidatus Cloacimonadota bacterium]
MLSDLNNVMEQGGWILPVLLVLSILGLGIALWRGLCLLLISRKLSAVAKQILGKCQGNSHSKRAELDLFLLEIQGGFVLIRIIASIAPLLGLLGTVLGLLEAFEAIASNGLGEPGIFASGISKALLTTIAGLFVAIPHLIALNFLERMVDLLGARLDCKLNLSEENS